MKPPLNGRPTRLIPAALDLPGPGQVLARMFRETHHATVLRNWGLLWMWHSLVLLVVCVLTHTLYSLGIENRWAGGLLQTSRGDHFQITIRSRIHGAGQRRILLKHHQQHQPEPVERPKSVRRETVEELTGAVNVWDEPLDLAESHVEDLKPWDVDAKTRALAELCLVLMNSNEFVFVY